MRISMISVHGDPLASLGGRQAGGQNIYVRNMAMNLAAAGHEVEVLTRYEGDGPKEEQICPGATVVRLEAGPPVFVDKSELPAILDQFRGLVSERWHNHGRPDVLHTNYWLSGAVGLDLRDHTDIALVHSYHSLGVAKRQAQSGGTDARRLMVESSIASTADRIVACTRYERDTLVRTYAARSRISIVPAGVDDRLFFRRHRRRAQRLTGIGPGTILFVGRPVPAKGLPELIEACGLLREGGKNVRLMAVGGRVPKLSGLSGQTGIDRSIDRLGLRDVVRLVGSRPQRELPWFYSAADVTAVPSWYENFGLVALEAQACGCPVVASSVGGLQQVVVNGYTGLGVPPRDPEQLATALAVLIENRRMRERMGRHANRLARRDYSWSSIARRVGRVYEQAIRTAARKKGQR